MIGTLCSYLGALEDREQVKRGRKDRPLAKERVKEIEATNVVAKRGINPAVEAHGNGDFSHESLELGSSINNISSKSAENLKNLAYINTEPVAANGALAANAPAEVIEVGAIDLGVANIGGAANISTKVSNLPKLNLEQQNTDAANLAAQAEIQLVRRAQAGDLAAFRELFENYYQRATSVALGVVGNQADAQDVVQEAFIKVYKKLNSFKGESSFYTWFYRIVYNLAIDTARKRYRKVENLVGDAVSLDQTIQTASRGAVASVNEVTTPEKELERKTLREQIAKAMTELSPEHRAVITLREIDGLSYTEISEAAGCSKGTVMSRLFHARRKLQKALSSEAKQNRDSLDSKHIGRERV